MTGSSLQAWQKRPVHRLPDKGQNIILVFTQAISNLQFREQTFHTCRRTGMVRAALWQCLKCKAMCIMKIHYWLLTGRYIVMMASWSSIQFDAAKGSYATHITGVLASETMSDVPGFMSIQSLYAGPSNTLYRSYWSGKQKNDRHHSAKENVPQNHQGTLQPQHYDHHVSISYGPFLKLCGTHSEEPGCKLREFIKSSIGVYIMHLAGRLMHRSQVAISVVKLLSRRSSWTDSALHCRFQAKL